MTWKDEPDGDGFYWYWPLGGDFDLTLIQIKGDCMLAFGDERAIPTELFEGLFLRIEPPRTRRCAGCGASLASRQSPYSGNHVFICETRDCPEAGLIRIDLGGQTDGV
jgi:hypothetical protein